MNEEKLAALRAGLAEKQLVLEARLARIRRNVSRPLDADSKERAKELEDSEVVDALGNEAVEELELIRTTVKRLDTGEYGVCRHCGRGIGDRRLEAWPYAAQCIDCARDGESAAARG